MEPFGTNERNWTAGEKEEVINGKIKRKDL